MNSSLGFWSTCQRSTSESSMFQSTVGRTRVPIFGRDDVSPLADRRRIASRTAVRETPNSSWMRGSVGSVSPGLYCPETIRRPIVPATSSERLPSRLRSPLVRPSRMSPTLPVGRLSYYFSATVFQTRSSGFQRPRSPIPWARCDGRNLSSQIDLAGDLFHHTFMVDQFERLSTSTNTEGSDSFPRPQARLAGRV